MDIDLLMKPAESCSCLPCWYYVVKEPRRVEKSIKTLLTQNWPLLWSFIYTLSQRSSDSLYLSFNIALELDVPLLYLSTLGCLVTPYNFEYFTLGRRVGNEHWGHAQLYHISQNLPWPQFAFPFHHFEGVATSGYFFSFIFCLRVPSLHSVRALIFLFFQSIFFLFL